MFKLKCFIIGLGVLLTSLNGYTWAESLSVDQYLTQVEARNPEIRAVDQGFDAMGLKILELDMVYSPFLSGAYTYMDDKSGSGFGSTLQMDEMKASQWSLGLSKKFSTGTSVSAGYSSTNSIINLSQAINLGAGPTTNFDGYEIKPVIRLDQSLLRDLGYGLTQVGIDKAKAGVRAAQYMQLFKRQQILLNARMTYWNLVLAKEVVAFRKISLERTQKLMQWNQTRVGLDLADSGDFLQAQAAFKSRQLTLQMADEDVLKAERAFNELMGTTLNAVAVNLDSLVDHVNKYADVPVLIRTGERADVLSARSAYASSEFADKETYLRSLPELSVSASYSLHGLALQSQAAMDQVTHSDKPTYMITLSGVVPLDYWTLEKVRDGYRRDYEAAKMQLAKAELTAANNWANLSRTWQDVKSRIALAQEVKTIQEKRLLNEQKRFQRGRSTTFQVLTAENDLDEATLNVYRLVFEELITAAQAALFNTQSLQ